MSDTFLKSTTRHVRIFTAKVVNEDLISDPDHLTMDLDPDDEFIWTDSAINKVQEKSEKTKVMECLMACVEDVTQ